MGYEGSEKRRFVRANFPCKIIIQTPLEHMIATHTEDIGAGGVRVLIEEKLDVHAQVNLELHLNGEPISCQARIVWVLEKKTPGIDESTLYDTGIEFSQIKDKDQKKINDMVKKIIDDKSSG
tara:strand:- start:2266 stop:2631 length:366 start_codon:yes stop_codon:yes gene_type:complete